MEECMEMADILQKNVEEIKALSEEMGGGVVKICNYEIYDLSISVTSTTLLLLIFDNLGIPTLGPSRNK